MNVGLQQREVVNGRARQFISCRMGAPDMSELGNLVRTANHWQPGMGRTPGAPSWSIFGDRPGQDATEKAVREGCKLLATRVNRDAGETMIESARRQLIADVQAY